MLEGFDFDKDLTGLPLSLARSLSLSLFISCSLAMHLSFSNLVPSLRLSLYLCVCCFWSLASLQLNYVFCVSSEPGVSPLPFSKRKLCVLSCDPCRMYPAFEDGMVLWSFMDALERFVIDPNLYWTDIKETYMYIHIHTHTKTRTRKRAWQVHPNKTKQKLIH